MVANFQKILNYEEFADVHVCHMNRSISAHRVVLAASSTLFRQRLWAVSAVPLALELSSLQCHGLLQSKGHGTVFAELELILHIIYRGWAQLRERSIGSLLETARCLQFDDVCELLQRTVQDAEPGLAHQDVESGLAHQDVESGLCHQDAALLTAPELCRQLAALIESYGLPPTTPETLAHFNENDFSGLTEEEKSPMAAKPPRVRRLRRRVTRVRQRKLPELISLDQSTVCQVCHRDLARMSALQRHLASAHPDRTAAGEEADERPPPSTVDASAISDPRDTCASLLQFRPRLSAAGPGQGSANEEPPTR
ncbi:uncharacterized protein LOC119111094 [Pollicipes pollicipes]|uniref:uncharacterized protein LOC119111094 n=1 Tax=Pollicipes pollicipes TaxID=41117 RepID=UPI001884C1B2|nr:uncharacterized protein LOC119111094 [Pollicipes pollicipes]